MSNFPEDYIRYVLDDISLFEGKRIVKKAGFLERTMTKHAYPRMMHPNPQDEFCNEDVGPSFEIINNYTAEIRNRLLPHGIEIFEEPIMVEKLEPEGYLILNGHHRWFAALRMGIPKIHIQIVNLVHEEDMDRMLGKNTNTKRVVFNLEEVLLADDESAQAPLVDLTFSKRCKERLKSGAPKAIKAFQDAGFDVWIYTSGFESEEYIALFFSMYEIAIEGMINGMNQQKKSNEKKIRRVKEKLATKYNCACHVDNETVIFINSVDKSFEEYAILDEAEDWAQGIVEIIRKLPVEELDTIETEFEESEPEKMESEKPEPEKPEPEKTESEKSESEKPEPEKPEPKKTEPEETE